MTFLNPLFGTSRDGAKVSSVTNEDVNARTGCNITAGSNVLNVDNNAIAAIGDLIAIHKAQGTSDSNSGKVRFARVIAKPSGQFTLDRPIDLTFADTGFDRSQCIRVPEYSSWMINSGIAITAPAFDGQGGGITIAFVNGTTTILGSIINNGKGYRGGQGEQDEGTTGWTGESYTRESIAHGWMASAGSIAPANGGGGRGGGQYIVGSGGGGGGGYGSAGANGGASDGNYGGGGPAYGLTDISDDIYFGSGGGGGYNRFGTVGANGGPGGGIIILVTRRLVCSSGAIYSQGNPGATGSQGGGGGAGGGIYVVSENADIGTDTIRADGGAAGGQTGGGQVGGAGGKGRIRLEVGTLSGTISSTVGDVVIAKGGHKWLARGGGIM